MVFFYNKEKLFQSSIYYLSAASLPAASGLIGPFPAEPLALLGRLLLLVAMVKVLDSTEVVTLGGGVGVCIRSGGGALLGRGGGVGV